MSEDDTKEGTSTAEETSQTEATVSPVDFCTYFLQQLEGGTVIVPVTAKGSTAYTVFQFGKQRFKISVSAVKRVRKLKDDDSPKGNGEDRDSTSEQEVVDFELA
jgi:hypothetical protein